MNSYFSGLSRSQLLSATAVGVALATSGITAGLAWVPGFVNANKLGTPQDNTEMTNEAMTASAAKCRGCGVIESLREIAASDDVSDASDSRQPLRRTEDSASKPASKRYEVTVRFKGGASRQFVDADPSKWRLGERVIFIEGGRSTE